ncbi:hypothetical protein BJ875DRAFT_483351 [Amylocarpus encephaloides]|uniref:Zn(2)-C6 fungal-type domain-containing protein n=1 Tax=Amylocarpus encephaloides TaxID=45428 RepID=A0A9P7YLR4_9HELO|nr:hypothetical protein BJ875DRAFT_483351 [Amylocarpus encephaloides]
MNKDKFRIQRVSGTPSRTGCISCKKRHIKCDETRPSCKRCLNARKPRVCEGYGPSTAATPDIATLKKREKIIHKTMPRAPSYELGSLPDVSQEEKRLLRAFFTFSAPCLAGHFPSIFWEKRVIQISMSEPCVRNAVIALGALHEYFNNGTLPVVYQKDPSSYLFALKQNTRAIGNLAQFLATDTPRMDLALTACILFVCFDSFHGKYQSAVIHLRSGLQILRQIDNSGLPYAKECKEEMGSVLMGLGVQACLFLDPQEDEHRMALWDDLKYATPSNPIRKFAVIEDARWSLSSIGAGMICDRGALEAIQDSPEYLKAKRRRLLSTWESNLKEFLSRLDKQDPNIDATLRRAALLKVCYYLSSVIGEAIEAEEHIYENIVNLCETIESSTLAYGTEPRQIFNFSADMGTVSSLFFVAMKCHNPTTRHRAWALMNRTPKKEGMWDSQICSDLVLKTMNRFDDEEHEAEATMTATMNNISIHNGDIIAGKPLRGEKGFFVMGKEPEVDIKM